MIVWITAAGLVVAAGAEAAPKMPPPPPVVAPTAPPRPVIYVPPPAPPAPPVQTSGTPARPLTNPGSWVTSMDYPIPAMRAGQSGTVGFRLTIDPSGTPVACMVTLSSGAAVLDETTCSLLMARARFAPGRTPNGKPAASLYSNSVRWNIPVDPPAPVMSGLPGAGLLPRFGQFYDSAEMHQPRPIGDTNQWITLEDYPPVAARARAEGTVGYKLDIDTEGKVSGCEVLSSSNSPLIDTATCRLIKQRGSFRPATDVQGKATTGTYWGTMRWSLPEEPDHPKPLHFRVSFTVDENGEVHDCRFETPSGEGVKMADALGRGCSGWMRYKPFTDEHGKPVSRRVTIAEDVSTDAPSDDAKAVPASNGPTLRNVPYVPGVRGG